jgi:isoleucyl-tRNA synthetase
MDYKDSLLLPNTQFQMRGNLPNNEPIRYAKWFESNVYQRMIDNRKDAEMFTLHDGPPYANGNIHIGHALNKTLKDIIVKMHYFNGKAVRFTPGWDCHGLPIEKEVEKKIGGKQKKEAMSSKEVRTMCRTHAQKFVDTQRDSFKSLGITANWDKPYLTMDYKFEANIYRTLCDVAKKGLLVERSKPVYWSWAERTALAEAEVEYEDKESHSIYVAFELNDAAKTKLNISGKAAPVIWTTTPWTLPANTGISFNPDEIYVLTEDGYIVAEKLYNAMIEQEVIKGKIAQKIEAKDLENLEAINPLNNRSSKLILGEHVLMDNGTGCVHTAPGHGEDDYRVGLLYDLEVVMPVDETGCYDETVIHNSLFKNPEEYVGKHIFKANDPILESLGDTLLKVSKFKHSYPHCWRSHTPLIFRATKQWFISVDAKAEGQDNTLREIAQDEIKKTRFIPETGRARLNSMVDNRPDWCISRQRDWGVPIAFFRVKETGEVLLQEKVLNFIAMVIEQQGSDAWYDLDIAQMLYPGSGYKPEELEKVTDILDVWFDSGSTWNAVLKSRNYDAGSYPADLYLEGSDQHRGWFQSSLFLSAAVNAKAPYKNVVTHGFTVDGKGEKMSKSKKNGVDPQDVLKQYGSEILRLWVALSDYQGDQKISDAILKQTADQYRKLRNTFRFLLASIEDLDAFAPIDSLGTLDAWILNKAKTVMDEVHTQFDNYEFVRGMAVLNNFVVNELSGIYMDITKDRLYCDVKDSETRKATQTAMAYILRSMLGLVAPILTYTCDEVYDNLPAFLKGEGNDIFDFIYEAIPEVASDLNTEALATARVKFSEIVDALKKEKVLKSTLELEIQTTDATLMGLNKKDREDWLVVSDINDKSTGEQMGNFEIEGVTFSIHKATQAKCPRCWKFQSTNEETLCSRCAEVMDA